MNTVAVIDYGMGNLGSVVRAVEECGGSPVVAEGPQDLAVADRIILPGVGAFPDGIANIKRRALDEALRDQVIGRRIPFLGICLGMQLLSEKGWEGGLTQGLNWIPGEVKRLEPAGTDTRIPHIGWNEVEFVRESPLFEGIESGKDFYFVHGYHMCPSGEDAVTARTPYGQGFVSAVQLGHIFGVQFHPEKSQQFGFRVLTNFLAL